MTVKTGHGKLTFFSNKVLKRASLTQQFY